MFPLLLVSALLQPAPEPDSDSVKGTPPLIVKAKVEKDSLVSITPVIQTVYQTVERERTVDGRVVKETVVVPVTVQSTVKKSWDLKKAKITNADGKKIDLDTLRKRLAVETLVVVSADGKPISKGYLKLMRADVLVLEAPLIPDPLPIAPK